MMEAFFPWNQRNYKQRGEKKKQKTMAVPYYKIISVYSMFDILKGLFHWKHKNL